MSDAHDPYDRGGFLAFLFSMVFSLGFFVYIIYFHPGVDLKEIPEDVLAEVQTLSGGETKAEAVDVSSIEKPWEENADVAQHGIAVYKANCAVCHGDKGLGDGPAGGALVPKPRNLVEGKWTAGGSSMGLYKTITDGLDGTSMAAFKHLSKVDRWAMVQYIRSITENKEADDAAELDSFAAAAE